LGVESQLLGQILFRDEQGRYRRLQGFGPATLKKGEFKPPTLYSLEEIERKGKLFFLPVIKDFLAKVLGASGKNSKQYG